MRTFTKRTKYVVAAAAAGTLALSGVAYAYWTTTGTGAGSATTSSGATAGLHVNQLVAPPSGDLAPGRPGSTLSGNVNNTTTAGLTGVSYALTAVKIDLTVTLAVGAPAGTCDASDYLIVSTNAIAPYAVTAGAGTITTKINAAGTPVDLAAGATGAAWTSTLSFVNTAANQDACKGATVNLDYTTVQS